jgi:outer membrane biosynthesis protein TonB
MISTRHPAPIDMMEVRQFVRQGATVSAIVHLLALALVILFSEVRPFGAVTTEPIAVDLVTPEEVAKKPEPQPGPTPEPKPEPKPTPALDLAQWTKQEATKQEATKETAKPAASPQAAPQAQDPLPQGQTARPSRQEAKLQPQASPPTAAPPASPTLGYTPAEPDVTVKYHVMLGLPEGLPPAVPSSGKKASDDFDATDSTAADISSSLIGEFRRHLKTCAKLPATVAPSDNLMVKLRLLMTVDGRLAADPLVGGGSANPRAFDLLHSAIDALKACQPYTMLPADRYGEWKVLDLELTPRDFSS